jgi:hypothetical protein
MAAVAPKAEKEELPEEDMDERGGGQAYADRRVKKEVDYASDDEDVGAAKEDDDGGDKKEVAAAGGGAANGGATTGNEGGGGVVKMETDGEAAKANGSSDQAAAPGKQGDEAFLNGATAPVAETKDQPAS